MKNHLSTLNTNATDLTQLRKDLVVLFENVRKQRGLTKFGYVSGIISSDGDDKAERNIAILAEHTEKIRYTSNFPIFSATDIFTKVLYEKLEETKKPRDEREAAFRTFWGEVLEMGKITDIFMTPRWEASGGAKDEHKTAQRLGITIHYVENYESK